VLDLVCDSRAIQLFGTCHKCSHMVHLIPTVGTTVLTMAQILSDNANGSAHIGARLKHKLKLGSRLADPANMECPELSYQKCAVNMLVHHEPATTGNKRPANPPTGMIDLLDSNDGNDNVESTRSGSNVVLFYLLILLINVSAAFKRLKRFDNNPDAASLVTEHDGKFTSYLSCYTNIFVIYPQPTRKLQIRHMRCTRNMMVSPCKGIQCTCGVDQLRVCTNSILTFCFVPKTLCLPPHTPLNAQTWQCDLI